MAGSSTAPATTEDPAIIIIHCKVGYLMECFVRLGQGRVEPVTSTFIGEGALQDFEGSPGCMGLVTVVKGCRLTHGGDWVYPGGELYAETRPKGRREDEDVLLPHVENLAGKWGVVLVIAALKALGWEIKGGGGTRAG